MHLVSLLCLLVVLLLSPAQGSIIVEFGSKMYPIPGQDNYGTVVDSYGDFVLAVSGGFFTVLYCETKDSCTEIHNQPCDALQVHFMGEYLVYASLADQMINVLHCTESGCQPHGNITMPTAVTDWIMDATSDYFVFTNRGSSDLWVASCDVDCEIISSYNNPSQAFRELVVNDDRLAVWAESKSLFLFNLLPTSFQQLNGYVPESRGFGLDGKLLAVFDATFSPPFGVLVVNYCENTPLTCQSATYFGPSGYPRIGSAVAVFENYIAATYTDVEGVAVVIYSCEEVECEVYEIIQFPDGSPTFGRALSFSSGTLVISDPEIDSTGAVYIYSFVVPPCNGRRFRYGCACYSGFTGDWCDQLPTGDCNFPTAVPHSSELIGTLAETSLQAGSLILLITTEPKDQRVVSVSFDGDCGYPGTLGSKGFDGSLCKDEYSFSIPVADLLSQCSWGLSSDEGTQVLQGTLNMMSWDKVGTFHGEDIFRKVVSAKDLEIRLPPTTSVRTTFTVSSQVDCQFVMTSQSYDPILDRGIILVKTSILWPFHLTLGGLMTSNRPEFTFGLTLDDNSGCDQGAVGSECQQLWAITLDDIAASSLCRLDGTYTFAIGYNCSTGFSETCPLDGSENVQATVTLASDDVCGTVSIISSVTADLTAYADAGLTSPQILFLGNEHIFFKSAVTADVSISSLSILGLRIVQNSVPMDIVLDSNQVDPLVNFNSTYLGNGEIAFEFEAIMRDGALGFTIFDSSLSGVFTFDVEVDIEIDYIINFGRKRSPHTKSVKVAQRLALDPRNPQNPKHPNLLKMQTNSGSAVSLATAGKVAAGALLFGLMALFI